MSVSPNSPVSSSNVNTAFVSKTQDSTMAGKLDQSNTTQSTSSSTGAITTDGGIGVAKQVVSGEGFIDEQFTGSKALVSDVTKKVVESTVTTTELEYLSGVTSDIQAQIDAKADDNAVVKLTGAQAVAGVKTFTDDTNFTQNVIIGGNLTVNGTSTSVNSATLDVTDTNITVNNGGNDATAEGAGLTVERTGTHGSLVYSNALTSKFAAGPLGSESEIITATTSQNISGNKTFSGSLIASGDVNLNESVDATTTGANAALSTSTPSVRLTNASLTSLATVTGASQGRLLIVTNSTGAPITIKNDFGVTASERILTGLGVDLPVPNQATIILQYNFNALRWQIVGGSGAGGANKTLSNLDSPTAINQYLLPDGPGQFVGTAADYWSSMTSENYELVDSGSGETIGLSAPSLSASYGLVLPATDGTSGQALTTDGLGNLSFSTIASGANTSLSNLASVDLNQNLETTKASSLIIRHNAQGEAISVLTANSTTASGDITIASGAGTSGGNSGSLSILTQSAIGGGDSGSITIATGNAPTSINQAGNLNITTGNSDTGPGGDVLINTGASNSDRSGDIVLQTNNTFGTTQGEIKFVEGSLTSATAGDVWTLADQATGAGYWQPTAASGESNTASNVGAGSGVFKQKTGVNLEFKSLVAGQNISIQNNANDLTINATSATLDTFFTQTFETAVLGDFTQTGLILDTTVGDVINGSVSAKLIHQPATNQSFQQTISLPRKYRGVNLSFSVFVRSSALPGEVTFTVFDVTNSTTLITQSLSYNNNPGGEENVISFDVPTTCTQVRYTVTALQEAGSPATFIDDIRGYLTQSEVVQSLLFDEQNSLIRLNTANGYGSTANKIRRFTNITTNFGDAILYQDSATNGASFTILKNGVYTFNYSDEFNVSSIIGLSLNSSNLTTDIVGISLGEALAMSQSFAANARIHVSWTGNLSSGDVIRPHTSGSASGVTPANARFTASYDGKVKQINTNPNSKFTIPTSELRFEGSSARGAVDTVIARFDTLAKIRGSAFTVVSNANNGTAITITKPGRITVSSTVTLGTLGNVIGVSKNQSNLTSASPPASELMAVSSNIYSNATNAHVAWSGDVVAGDVIRIFASTTPSANTYNSFNITHQEQDVALSVSNLLPKFTEADSSVRLNTSNGYGSTATQIRRFSNITENIGTDILYQDSATQGASFTILKDGTYNIHYGDFFNAQSSLGITLNSAALTTGVGTLVAQPNNSTVLAANSAAANQYQNVTWSGYLPAGSVIRAHAEAAGTGDADAARFTISKVGKPNITAVDVTPFVDIPQNLMEAVSGRVTVVGTNITAFDAITSNTASKLITSPTLVSGRIRFTVLKRSLINVASGVRATNNAATAEIFVDGVSRGQLQGVVSFQDPTVGGGALTEVINANSIVEIFLANQDSSSGNPFSYSAIGVSDQIITEVETFNSDTATFAYAGSATYTLATLQNAPVGTFITFTYGAGSNGVTQTNAAPPTQTTADMNVNGIRIYSIPYNSASTSALPASIAIQIGKGLKGLNLGIYKSANKAIPGTIDFYTQSGNKRGLSFKNYNETTGILYLDARFDGLGGSTASTFEFVDNSVQADGYLVINASKNPALAGLNSVEPLVAASYWLSATGSVTANTPVNYDSREYDPYLAVSTGANWRFTCPVGKAGYYLLNGAINAVTASFGFVLFKNNSQYKQISWDGVAIDACFSATVYLSDNEFIDVRPNVTNTFNGSATLASSTNNITITRLGSRG